VKYKSFLLVDDIVTSGATASEAAKPLMDAGAKRVDIVAFARGASVGK
jgi:predicted amidophosphoribosyltransferase